ATLPQLWKELPQLWKDLQQRYSTRLPYVIQPTSPQREAEQCETTSQWFAAVWHLTKMIEVEPANAALIARRGQAYANLAADCRDLFPLHDRSDEYLPYLPHYLENRSDYHRAEAIKDYS